MFLLNLCSSLEFTGIHLTMDVRVSSFVILSIFKYRSIFRNVILSLCVPNMKLREGQQWDR